MRICQIKRRYVGNFFLKRANKSFYVSGPRNLRVLWELKCHQKSHGDPTVVSDGYVKYEEAEVHRSAIMQDIYGHFEIICSKKLIIG